MSNISIATFQCGSRSCKLYGLWQYDYGQILRIQDLGLPPAVEIHFSLTEKGGSSITRVGTTKDGVTDVVIPDSLLENDDASQDYWIYAYIYLTDETSGSTEYKIVMKVKSRPRPEAIDRPEDQELFREAIAAVNEAAERAENAVNNLNADVSEKVTRPDTAEVGQALVVKEIDETGKPTTFEAQDMVEVPEWAQKPEKPTYTAKEVGALPDDTKIPTKVSELENDSGYLTEHQDISGKLDAVKLPEAIDTALAEAKESGVFDGADGAPGEKGEKGDKGEPGETTYIENPYDDTDLKSEIATKITAPENPEVGKVFRIKTVNEDGTFIGEWADGGVANLDVQIAGKSIVTDGVAEIPIASSSTFWVVKYLSSFGISTNTGGKTGYLAVMQTSKLNIDGRRNDYQPISAPILDYAVKAAMCDGKGAAWTAEEQAAARERMEIDGWKLVADITLEEEVGRIKITLEEHHTEAIVLFKTNVPCVVGENSGANYFTAGDNSVAYLGAISGTNQYINFSAHILRCGDYWVPLMVMSNQKESVGVFDKYKNNENIAQKVKYSKELAVYNTTSFASDGDKYPIGATMTVMAR